MDIVLIGIRKSQRKVLTHHLNPIMEYVMDKKADDITQQV